MVSARQITLFSVSLFYLSFALEAELDRDKRVTWRRRQSNLPYRLVDQID